MFWVSYFGTALCTFITGLVAVVGIRHSNTNAEFAFVVIAIIGAVTGVISMLHQAGLV